MSEEYTNTWGFQIYSGISGLLDELAEAGHIQLEHFDKTPNRFREALKEYTSGYSQNPREVLKKSFTEDKYNQMVFVNDIEFISHCIHHIAPFAGKAYFGYIPNGKVVGLSKIPRAFDILARRLQIQEQLSDQMVDIFNEEVKPAGCGIIILATHFCMCARGVRKMGTYTRTTSLRGNFLTNEKTKQEFLEGAKPLANSLL